MPSTRSAVLAAQSIGFVSLEPADVKKRTIRSVTSLVVSSSSTLDETPKKRCKEIKQEPVVVTPPPSTKRKLANSNSSSINSPAKATKVVPPEPGSRDPPKDYEAIYSLVEELRADRSAPVDDNGSEALPQRDLGDEVFRFQVLIALMLSSQTKDNVVGEAMRALQYHGLTVENISNTPAETLNKLIQKVGFHNNKTKYIKQAVEVLKNDYDGDIPSAPEDMMKLAGVGPKMAYIVENVAWGRTTGIGVDTHMHRMFNELKWVSSKNPEQTRVQLESWLPREKWETVNVLWVGFGQEVQQFKSKLLEKVLNCSRPHEALRLVKRLGLDYRKEAIKAGLEEKLQLVIDSKTTIKIED